MGDNKVQFKNSYIGIFSLNYFIQGINQSMFAVIIPIYLIFELGTLGGENIAFLTSIVLFPFALKFIYGMLSDKIALKNLGRRKPWIIGSMMASGSIWIFIPFIIKAETAFIIFTLGGILIVLGVAIADTSIDGLILDICPKEKLGRVQGICWGIRSLGIIVGGPLIVVLYLLIGGSIDLIFIVLGILMTVSTLTILLVKEIIITKDIKIIPSLKLIFGKASNWKVYLYSLFNSFVDGVIFVFLSLYIIIQTPLLEAEGATIEILETNVDLYGPNAFISFIIGLGVITGSLIGGHIADLISRKISVYSSLLITIIFLLLFLIPVSVPIMIIFAFFIGSSAGWRQAGFSAVIGQISTKYPEVDSTYFATCNSFTNLGAVLGLQITGLLFSGLTGLSTYAIYASIFVFMVLMSNLGLIPFLTINSNEYEITSKRKETIKT
ncbi:MAG: MFS transporter [Candidatus Hodarchaeota archaeon]